MNQACLDLSIDTERWNLGGDICQEDIVMWGHTRSWLELC